MDTGLPETDPASESTLSYPSAGIVRFEFVVRT